MHATLKADIWRRGWNISFKNGWNIKSLLGHFMWYISILCNMDEFIHRHFANTNRLSKSENNQTDDTYENNVN